MASRRKHLGGKRRKLSYGSLALLILFIILASVATFLMFKYQFLNFRQINYLLTIVALAVAVLSLVLILLKRLKVFTITLLLIGSLISGVGIYGFTSAIKLADKITSTSNYSEYAMAVLVRADDEATDVSQIDSVSAPTENDSTNITALIEKIKTEKGVELSVETVASYVDAYQDLIDGKVRAIVMNSAFEDIILSDDAEYNDKVRKIYTSNVTQKITAPAEAKTDEETAEEDSKKVATDGDVFNIYISGIDTYGAVSTVSRSDVNIIVTVNRKTKQILLTTTPRDSYVPIADGGNNQYDKLTHAGIYGVNASLHTLENLYDINIDYYARLNFTSFITMVDLLGGIEVYNDQAFTSTHGGYDFPVGNVTMNSEQALGFVRERYSLQKGDNDRGRNQEKVIAAIINKLTSTDALKNYQAIIDELGTSIQTNMDLKTMMGLVNDQLADNSQYTIHSQALEGSGSTGVLTSYAMPTSRLYMVQVNDESLASVKAAINQTLEGE